jgi:L-alanine-DL-glutamate epimerase-like enolase superfamily enzyme
MARITRVEVHEFTFQAKNLGLPDGNTNAVYNVGYKAGARLDVSKYAIRIHDADGAVGEYVTHWVGTKIALAQTLLLAPYLVGQDSTMREHIWDEMKRELRQYDHMGHGPIDIALWDLVGKQTGKSVSDLLGRYRERLPAYASTYHGDRHGGLSSPEAFAAFAEVCYGYGYRAYKLHGWHEGNAREEARNVLHVARAVGDRMQLMLDPACELRTFADAVYVGKACDEGNYFWYEDPFRDSGVSAFAHKKLREMIKTPILQTEHVRGVEPKADFLMAGGTDFLRADPEYDMGITGTMKIAHFAEACGVDVELHACGPAHRHCMAAMRNSNFYEVALLGPDTPNAIPPVYTCGYNDQIDCVGLDGCVPVPTGPGLGVTYDWDFIQRNRTAHHVFE